VTLTLWHNPRCSKSRATLTLLLDRGYDPQLRLYLQTPPTAAEIRAVQAALGLPLIAMMRPKDKLFQELGLSADSKEPALLAAMVAHPSLIERPILINGDKAAIGRPPDAVMTIL